MDTACTGETLLGRAAHYRSEAARIAGLAAATTPEAGGDRFRQVADEYRALADYLDPPAEAAA